MYYVGHALTANERRALGNGAMSDSGTRKARCGSKSTRRPVPLDLQRCHGYAIADFDLILLLFSRVG